MKAENRDAGPRSLTRVLGLFDVLAKNPSGLSLAELSEQLDSPKSSLLNLFRPLVADEFLLHAGGIYKLGPSIYRLSSKIMSVWNFSGHIRPLLEELARRSRETVYIAVLDKSRGMTTYVDAIDSTQSIRYAITIGASSPLYCTAAGRLLLAHAEPEWLHEYVKEVKFERRTPHTIASRRALLRELKVIRDTGVSVSAGELFADSAAIAAPVTDSKGKVVAAIAIAAPLDRLDSALPSLTELLSEISVRASMATVD